jgi:hypothetical protein
MKEECQHQEELIGKLTKKKAINESKLMKRNNFRTNKLKIRLAKSLDEVEDNPDREKTSTRVVHRCVLQIRKI